MTHQNPVIVIPGITASELLDDYPLKTDEVWTMVLNKEFERIALHPDDLRYEAVEPAHVYAGRAFPIYNDLIRSLRHELSARADQPTPVFAFPYDWRVDIRLTARRLGQLVEEVIARTLLLKHYANPVDLRVDLVGHSMGGLIILEYLAQARSKARVGKVVTIGTPFLGSVEAIVKITTGMSLLTGAEPKEREREAARVTPAVYQLFPSYDGAAVDTGGEALDIFDSANMQTSVLDSLAEFVRLYSVSTRASDRRGRAGEILRGLLDRGREHRKAVMGFKPAIAGITQVDWLCVIGVGQKTRVQLTVGRDSRGPRFVINESQFVNELGAANSSSHRTGDGTVALDGALPPFLPITQPVCVMEDDLSLFELRDRLLVQLGGFHGLLPSLNLVQRLTIRHLLSRFGGGVWGRRVPGAGSWSPPIPGLAATERYY